MKEIWDFIQGHSMFPSSLCLTITPQARGLWVCSSLCLEHQFPRYSHGRFLLPPSSLSSWNFLREAFLFSFDHMACGTEIKPGPPALEAQSLNHWTTREFPQWATLIPTEVSTAWGLVAVMERKGDRGCVASWVWRHTHLSSYHRAPCRAR